MSESPSNNTDLTCSSYSHASFHLGSTHDQKSAKYIGPASAVPGGGRGRRVVLDGRYAPVVVLQIAHEKCRLRRSLSPCTHLSNRSGVPVRHCYDMLHCPLAACARVNQLELVPAGIQQRTMPDPLSEHASLDQSGSAVRMSSRSSAGRRPSTPWRPARGRPGRCRRRRWRPARRRRPTPPTAAPTAPGCPAAPAGSRQGCPPALGRQHGLSTGLSSCS